MATPLEPGNRPDFDICIGVDKNAEGRDGHLQKAGVAWSLRDKDGISGKLTMVPVHGWDGRFVLLPHRAPLQDVYERDENGELVKVRKWVS